MSGNAYRDLPRFHGGSTFRREGGGLVVRGLVVPGWLYAQRLPEWFRGVPS